jgi:hypothetical protein
MPTNISYTKIDGGTDSSSSDSACWTALRAHEYVLPMNMQQLSPFYSQDVLGKMITYKSVEVQYNSNCTQFVDTGTIEQALGEVNTSDYFIRYQTGNCRMGYDVECVLFDEDDKSCRMNVRVGFPLP